MTQAAPNAVSPRRIRGCRTMVNLSRFVAWWIAKQPAVGEESITDLYLFELAEQVPRIRYRKFNRVVEGRETGADWEWWFLFSDGSLVLRVQAKKLVTGEDQYAAVAYSNRRGLQIEMLMRDAHKHNFLPFYAFYYDTRLGQPPLCPAPIPDQGAVLLSDAASLYRAFISGGRKPVSVLDLVSLSTHASCLLCCPLTMRPRGVDGLRRYLRTHHPYAFTGANGEERLSAGVVEGTPPPYVLRLLEGARQAERDDTESPPPDNIGALLLLDMREDR